MEYTTVRVEKWIIDRIKKDYPLCKSANKCLRALMIIAGKYEPPENPEDKELVELFAQLKYYLNCRLKKIETTLQETIDMVKESEPKPIKKAFPGVGFAPVSDME